MAKKNAAQKTTPARLTIADQLREIVESRGLTHTELGQLAGVDPTVIARFVAGERDLRLETAGRIAAALGLRLVEVATPKGRGRASRTPAG